MTGTSAALLGTDPPATPLGLILAESPRNAPPFLSERIPEPPRLEQVFSGPPQAVILPTYYRLYAVDPAALPK